MNAIDILEFCKKQVELYEIAVAKKEEDLATIQVQLQNLKGAIGSLKLVIAQFDNMFTPLELPILPAPDDNGTS